MVERNDDGSQSEEPKNRNPRPANIQRRSLWKRTRPQVPSALFAQPIIDRTDEQSQTKSVSGVSKPKFLARNQKLSYIIALTHYVGFLTPIWVIFGTDHLNLSLTAALVLGSTSWVASAFFEIPMGAFADKYGRKLSVVLGLLFCAIGDLALVFLNNFFILMVFQVLAGVGFSMRSGSLEGLLHDTYEAAKDKTGYSKLSSQILFLLNASRVLTVPLGAWLYNLDPDATLSSRTFPYVASVVSYIVALTAASMLIEKRSQDQPAEIASVEAGRIASWFIGQVGETINEMRANIDVVRIVAILGMYALIGEGNWALYQSYFRDHNIGIGASGWIFTGLVICMALGSLFVPQIYSRFNVMWALIFIVGLVSFNIGIMAIDGIWSPIVIAAFIVNSFVSPMTLYLHDNAIQNRMSGNHKVTALSLASVAYTFGAAIGVWGVGTIADHFGVDRAQLVFVIFGVIVVLIGSLWCRGESLEVLPEDHVATHEPMIEEPKDQPYIRRRSIPDGPNDIER